jgi:prepilin-type N-terminal cleavage/methylation domain-containing protein
MGFKVVRGFTLIEIVITVVVIAIVSVVLVTVLNESFKVWFRAGEQETIRTSVRDALIRISKDIMEAPVIIGSPYTGGVEISFSYDADSDGDDDLCRYYRSSNRLLFSIGGGSPITLATGITSITFNVSTLATPTYGTEVEVKVWAKDKGRDLDFRTKIASRGNRQ